VIRKIICINSVCIILLTTVLCLYPPLMAVWNIHDPALKGPGIPKSAWGFYRSLTPRFAAWAHDPAEGGRAADLNRDTMSGAEKPLFASVFYLCAVENLQAAWDAGDHTPGVAPNVFARDGIVAASELVIDPRHAAWIQDQWNLAYLTNQDVLYRALIITALTSREQLLHDGAHLDILRDQVESLCGEIDASKIGLLDTYPGQCFPRDVMAAIASVRRADAVLHTNHAAFVTKAVRGFIGSHSERLGLIHFSPTANGHRDLQIEGELPPFQVSNRNGGMITEASGGASSCICLFSPELWPAEARQWFATYESFFWQERFGAAGFREFRNDLPGHQWLLNADGGVVLAGYSLAADTFGIGAARKNGRFDRAYPIESEMLATVWELPGGFLAVPRFLSSLCGTPVLGETALLWQLTVQPEKGFAVKTGGSVPVFVYVVIIGALALGTWRILETIWTIREPWPEPEPEWRHQNLQIFLWLLCMAGALVIVWTRFWWLAVFLLFAAQLFPRWKKPPVDDWDEKARAAGKPDVDPKTSK
jgi:hypothetical protein